MSNIPSSRDLLNAISSNDEYKPFKLATVYALFSNGFPQIKFDGETSPSNKKYSYLASYTPTANDRVILAAIGGTYVILGKIKF